VKEAVAQQERGLLARLVLDNYPLKLLAFALALALFSIVHSDQDAQRSVMVDVVALLPARNSNQVLVSPLPAQVKVTLRGSRSRIAALQHDDFAPVQLDLREPGRASYHIETSAIDVTGPVQVVGVEPAYVPLSWRPRAERVVPTAAKLRGQAETGFIVKRPVVVAPSSVRVSGPKDELDLLRDVETEEVAVDHMSEGAYERRVRLEPPAGHVAFIDPDLVSVRVEVVGEQGERTFRHLTIAAVGPGEATLRPDAVSVTLQGPIHGLTELEPEQIVPFVELSSASAGVGVEVLDVKLRGVPEAFKQLRITPASVIVRRSR
jgi:YbbR domain-containing protein